MDMGELFFGRSRSTRHATAVNRVRSHLKRICTVAEKETGLVASRLTDAWGYDRNTKTWYLCEIKVNPNDLLKAVTQIHDTCYKFKPKDPEDTVIPVIAIPKRLYDHFVKVDVDQWKSFRTLCDKTHIAIWIIEQSAIPQIQGPKPKVKTKPKATTKAKTTAKPKAATKSKTTTKAKTTAKPKAAAKSKTTTKAKTTAKPKAATKSKTTTKVRATTKAKTAAKAKATTKAKTATKAKASTKIKRK